MVTDPFRLGIVSELHIVPPGTTPQRWHNQFLSDQAELLARKAFSRFLEHRVDAIAILGDLTHFADPGSFAVVRRVLEMVELPIYVLPGNHDLDTSERPLRVFQRALDLPHVTVAPANLALTPEIDLMLVGLQPGAGEKRFASIRSHAPTGNQPKLTVALTHFPAFAMAEMLAGAGLKHAGDLADREALFASLAETPEPLLIVNGHLHVHASIADGPRLQLSAAALIEPPHDATILTIGFADTGEPWIERQAFGLVQTPGVSLPVLSERTERWHVEDGAWQPGSV